MIHTGAELAAAAKNVAKNYNTLYVMGCFGAPLTGANVERYCTNHEYNKQSNRTAMIKARADRNPPFYGFDCVNLIKALLWGWDGSPEAKYGGAKYASNGVPDVNADYMIQLCKDVSADFSNIEIGEAVWEPGHIGIDIGGGIAAECTPRWANGVQITSCNCAVGGYHRRDWKKHGKLPYIAYDSEGAENQPEPSEPAGSKTVDELAREVIAGRWGSGSARREKLTAAGHDYNTVQARVNEILSKPAESKTVDELAREVIKGKWGNGAARREKLTAAGHDYNAIQKRVNQLTK